MTFDLSVVGRLEASGVEHHERTVIAANAPARISNVLREKGLRFGESG